MRHFDPIDILFICLISCYLVTFAGILIMIYLKYKKQKKEDAILNRKEIIEKPKKLVEDKSTKKNVARKKVSKNSNNFKNSSSKKASKKKKTNSKKSTTNKSVTKKYKNKKTKAKKKSTQK